MKYAKRAFATLAAGVCLMGAECINDPFLVSVNVEALSVTYNLNGGTTLTTSGSKTLTAAEYLSGDFADLQNLRIYDITLETTGTYTGTVSGTGTVNGTNLVSWSGLNWNALHTPASLLAPSSPLLLNAAGIAALQSAVQGSANVTLAGSASASTAPAPVGTVTIRVYAQVDADPT